MNAKLESLQALLGKRRDDYIRFNTKPESFWLTWKGDSKKVILSRIQNDIDKTESEITKLSNH